MGFSVATSTHMSSVMAEIAIAQAEGAGEADELNFSQELMDPEILKELFQQGCLRGESKAFTFILKEGASILQKFTDYLADINRPQQQKNCDPKGSEHHLSFKESLTREKVFKVLELQKPHVEEKSREDGRTFEKTHVAMHRTFKNAALPQSLQQPLAQREYPALKQQDNHAKHLEHRLQSSFTAPKEGQPKTTGHEAVRKQTEERKHMRQEREREAPHPSSQRFERNRHEEREQDQQRKHQDDEEGFAEGQKDQQQKPQEEHTTNSKRKVGKIEEKFATDFANYTVEESILSEIFKMRVTQFDVLLLFLEILKLEIRGREQERIARRQERELQILHMQNIVDNYKSQGKWLMLSSLGSGVLAIVSGACPIIGHMKGDWIIQKLGGVFSSLRDMKQDQFFKGITKITFAMSEMYKSTGQIHNTFSEGNRTFDQHMSDIHRTDWEENTRTMEEIKDNWKGIENFLYQALQMYHDTIRQLYSQ